MSAYALDNLTTKIKSRFTEIDFSVSVSKVVKSLVIPFIGMLVFLMLWQAAANNIVTSLGLFPGPTEVWEQSKGLITEHKAERIKEEEFYERQYVRNAEILAEDPEAEVRIRNYTGRPTFFDQVITSLKTVAFGFIIATLVAIPLGIVCGLSDIT